MTYELEECWGFPVGYSCRKCGRTVGSSTGDEENKLCSDCIEHDAEESVEELLKCESWT